MSFKPHTDCFPLRCLYITNNESKGAHAKTTVLSCKDGMLIGTLLDEFSASWALDVFQRDTLTAYFADGTALSEADAIDMDKTEWVRAALERGVVPTLIITCGENNNNSKTRGCEITNVHKPQIGKGFCWETLFKIIPGTQLKQGMLSSSSASTTETATQLLQIRIPEGGQVINAQCRWETTFAEIKEKVVPTQLQSHGGPRDLSRITVEAPPQIKDPSQDKSSFFRLCKVSHCLPYVVVRDAVPRDITPVRCEIHHSDCIIVDPNEPPSSHYPESKASDFRINMEISNILKDRPSGSSSATTSPSTATADSHSSFFADEEELAGFRAATKRLRFRVLGGGVGGVGGGGGGTASGLGAYSALPRTVSSSPHAFPPGEMLLAAVTLPLRQMVKTVPLRPGISADAFEVSIFERFYAKTVPAGKTAQDYVLKVKGLNSYLEGMDPVLHFAHIQNALLKKARPELVLIERPPADTSFERDEHYTFANLLAIRDDGVEYRYDNIAMRNVPVARRVCVPSWDLTATLFCVKVVGIDRTQAGVVPGTPCFVVVELFYGDYPLCPHGTTTESSSLQWNEHVTLDIPISQIPLEARVCFTLYEAQYATQQSQQQQQQQQQSQLTLQQQEQLSEQIMLQQQQMLTPQQQQQLLLQQHAMMAQSGDGAFKKPLGWVSCTVFDYMNVLRRGKKIFYLWPNERANPAGGSWESCLPSKAAGKLIVEFEDYLTPVVFPTHGTPSTQSSDSAAAPTNASQQQQQKQQARKSNSFVGVVSEVSPEQQKLLSELEGKDSLYRLTEADRKVLWAHRNVVMQRPRLLGKVLQAINYRNAAEVVEGHKLMAKVHLTQDDALELLASKFPDRIVREYAVQSLRRMTTEDLMSYLLELVQALKYEPRHNSALATLLLERGYLSAAVGNELYWALKSGMAYGDSPARFRAVMDAFLRGCGEGRNAILLQEEFLGALQTISREVKALRDNERLDHLRRRLRTIPTPRGLFVPVRPDFLIGGIEIDKCSYKDSKKLPLYVVLRNADPGCDSFHMIFKEGDDLRQDGLTLQMIRIMDKMWKEVGLDLDMLPYRTICTEAASGLIEVVLNAKTTAEIHKAAGGASAAFRQDPLANWLRQHNPTEDMYRPCVRRFLRSCAGYCVATYVLGIGDRHNDNIMLTTSGNLFHIDFGHFLGHKKYFLGFNREPASFVFTPDFAYVMGGKGAPDFEEFVDTACKAYLVLRRHSSTFINLFALMLSTGIPELKSPADIDYLREAFALGLDDAAASQRFKDLIFSSLATWTTRLNNAIHIAMH